MFGHYPLYLFCCLAAFHSIAADGEDVYIELCEVTNCKLIPGWDKGFVKISGNYYSVHMEKLSWFAANNKCRSMGAHLVSFKTEEDYKQLVYYMSSIYGVVRGREMWTSYTNLGGTDGFYSAATGQNWTFSNWYTGQPKRPDKANGRRNCVELVSGDYYRPFINLCEDDSSFICHIRPGQSLHFIIH